MQSVGEVVLKRSNSKEEQNVAAGGVLLKRSNSKEEQNVAEAKAEALQASLVTFFAVCLPFSKFYYSTIQCTAMPS